MNPQNATQSEKPQPPPAIRNPYVTPSTVAPAPPKAADYAYRIAALSTGIFLLATLL
jgi:hypothetical protein